MPDAAGSSAPEAARAAEAARDLKWARMFAEAEDDWESCVNSIYGPSVAVFVYQDQVKAATALADLEVAAATSAAVAEERAAVGALLLNLADEIETLGTDDGKDYAHPYARDGYQSAADYVRSRRIDWENAN